METSTISTPRASGVTTRHVAARAGVAQASVSAVLNGGTGRSVSPATRQRILEAAEELGYRRNHAAGAMRTGNTHMLGWIGGELGEEQVGKMLSGALEAADAGGYTLKILRLGDLGNAQQVIRRSSELRLMGVLALHLPFATQSELHHEAKRYGYPLVLVDGRAGESEILGVASDDEGGIGAGVDHLVGLGHRRIAFISGGEEQSALYSARKDAFLSAMRAHGLSVPPDFIGHGEFSLCAPSQKAAHELLCLPPERRPTAIFCSGDLIALATMQVARQLGITLPEELSIVGFANMSASEFAFPPLTTIEQPFADIGRVAVRLLLEVVETQLKAATPQPDGVPHNPLPEKPAFNPVRLPTRLIERASTAPAPVEPGTAFRL